MRYVDPSRVRIWALDGLRRLGSAPNAKKHITSAFMVAVAVAIGVIAPRYGIGSRETPTARVAEAVASTSIGTSGPRSGQALTEKVNINTADEMALMTLTGIGAAKAKAILDDRNTRGLFYEIEDIMRVKGIGTAMFAAIEENITVGNIGSRPPEKNATRVKTQAASASAAPHTSVEVFIRVVMTGKKGASADEYIILHNPEAFAVDLAGWSLKRKSSTGSTQSLVASSRFKGKQIAAGSDFLIVNDLGYSGNAVPDARWPSSYTLSSATSAVILIGSDGNVVDTASWGSVQDGLHCERDAKSESCRYMAD